MEDAEGSFAIFVKPAEHSNAIESKKGEKETEQEEEEEEKSVRKIKGK